MAFAYKDNPVVSWRSGRRGYRMEKYYSVKYEEPKCTLLRNRYCLQ